MRSPSTARLELLRHGRGRRRGGRGGRSSGRRSAPDGRRQHRQAADLELLDRDVAGLEPALDEPGSLADARRRRTCHSGSVARLVLSRPAQSAALRGMEMGTRGPLVRSRQTESASLPTRSRVPRGCVRAGVRAEPQQLDQRRPWGGMGPRPTPPSSSGKAARSSPATSATSSRPAGSRLESRSATRCQRAPVARLRQAGSTIGRCGLMVVSDRTSAAISSSNVAHRCDKLRLCLTCAG